MFMDFPDLTEEELRRIQASNSPAPVAGGSFGEDPRMAAALANGNQAKAALAAPFADAASMIGARLGMGASFLGGQPETYQHYSATANPVLPPTYQHYSATANPMSPAAVEAQSNREYTPFTLPEDKPGFFGSLGSSLFNQQQPLWKNVSGPPAPAQRESAWRNDNGVMINDGFGGMPMSTANAPGAGYTSQGMDGINRPLPFSTDADYGARLSTDPYTNPVIQDQIRRHAFAKDLANMGFMQDLAKIKMSLGVRDSHNQEQEQQRILHSLDDPLMSQEVKNAEIDRLKLSDQQKNFMKLDVATSKYDPKTKQYKPITALGDALSRIPSDIPKEQIDKYLTEKLMISQDFRKQRIDLITQTIKEGTPLSEDQKKEYTAMVRLGLMPTVEKSRVGKFEQWGIGHWMKGGPFSPFGG